MKNKTIQITLDFHMFDALTVMLECPWSVRITSDILYRLLLLEKYDIVRKLSLSGSMFSMVLPSNVPNNIVMDLIKYRIIDESSIPDDVQLDMCTICQLYLNDDINILRCTHSFHRKCLQKWVYASTDHQPNDVTNLGFLTAKCTSCHSNIYDVIIRS
jgi:hypothetical protein